MGMYCFQPIGSRIHPEVVVWNTCCCGNKGTERVADGDGKKTSRLKPECNLCRSFNVILGFADTIPQHDRDTFAPVSNVKSLVPGKCELTERKGKGRILSEEVAGVKYSLIFYSWVLSDTEQMSLW